MAEFTVLKEYPITDIVYSEEENEFYSQVFNGMAVEGMADAILIAKLLVSVAGTDTTAREQLKITLRILWKAIFTNLRSIDLVQFKAICRFVKVLGMTDDQTRTALSKPAEILKFDENTLNSILQTSRISPNQDNPTGSPQKVTQPLDQVQSKSTSPGKVVTTTVPAATNRKPIKVGAIYFEPLNPPHFTSQDYENYSQILSKILLTREQEYYSHTDLSELIDAFPTAKPGIKHAIWKLVADQNDQTSPKGSFTDSCRGPVFVLAAESRQVRISCFS